MCHQRGITVVELLVVVAVFSGLAAVALPRFALLDEASRLEAVRSLADEIRTTAELSHSIWVSAGRPAELARDDVTVEMINGYPSPDDMAELIPYESMFKRIDGRYEYADRGRAVSDCYVSYQPPDYTLSGPDIAVVVTGC